MSSGPTIPDWFHVGVWLHASCSDEWFGPVTRVGKDVNGTDVVDFEFDGRLLDEFLDAEDVDDGRPNLCTVEVPDGPCIMRDVPIERLTQERDDYRTVMLATPGRGCLRCTGLFSVHEARR